MGCCFQGLFPAQRLYPGVLGLLYWQVGSLLTHHLGSPLSLRGYCEALDRSPCAVRGSLLVACLTCGCCLAAELCLTLFDPMDCSLPGSSVQGISQAGVLERVPIPFSGDLPKPRIKPASSALQADSLPMSHLGSPFYE